MKIENRFQVFNMNYNLIFIDQEKNIIYNEIEIEI